MGADGEALRFGWSVRTGRVDLKGKNVLVLGLGDTGLSMARWGVRRGAFVRVADTRATPPRVEDLAGSLPGVRLDTGAFRAASFDSADVIAISPGIPVQEPEVARARARGVPVWGDVEFFAQAVQENARPHILAITGTNGKTTVTSMTGALCRAAEMDACVAGNIAPAVLDALMEREDAGRMPDVWVLELPSFQLEITYSLNATAATVLKLYSLSAFLSYMQMVVAAALMAARQTRLIFAGSVEIGDRLLVRLELVAQLLVLPLEHLVPAEVIDGPMFGGGHEPRAGIAWHAGRGPLLERGKERVLREILGDADVPDNAGETGDDFRRLHLPDCLDGALGFGSRHGYRSHHHRIRPCKAQFVDTTVSGPCAPAGALPPREAPASAPLRNRRARTPVESRSRSHRRVDSGSA